MTISAVPTLLLLAFMPAPPIGDTVNLNSLIDSICREHAAPAGLAALIRDGKVEALGVSGVRELGGDAAEIGDVTMIGSCGKSVTRLLLARLVDHGKLSFDATLGELLPDVAMRDDYKSVKLGDVIAHRAGIQPYENIGPRITPHLFDLTGTPREQRAAFVAHFLNEAPAAPPGTRFVYSNAGYCLLGHIAERTIDTPFEELVAKEVFQPLEMRDARVGLPDSKPRGPFLTGHVRTPDGYEIARPRPALHVFAPAGVMSCTIGDFAKLADALWRIEAGAPLDLLNPESAARVRELRPGGIGAAGVPFFGGDGHYTAAYALWPDSKLAIVAATNAGDNDAVCAALLEAVRAKHAPDAKPVADQAQPPKSPLGILLEAPDPDHVLIKEVKPDSLAAKGGLQAGDRLVEINGAAVNELDADGLRTALAAQRLVLKVERAGGTVELRIERPAP